MHPLFFVCSLLLSFVRPWVGGGAIQVRFLWVEVARPEPPGLRPACGAGLLRSTRFGGELLLLLVALVLEVAEVLVLVVGLVLVLVALVLLVVVVMVVVLVLVLFMFVLLVLLAVMFASVVVVVLVVLIWTRVFCVGVFSC